MMKGFDKVNFSQFFEFFKVEKTSGHCFKLSKRQCRGERRRNFFTQRVVNHWNKLPQEVVDADSINSFKNRLDKLCSY